MSSQPLWGESLYDDIMTLIYDCHDCVHIKDASCPNWCHEFIKQQVLDIVERVSEGSYNKEGEDG